MTEYAKTIFPLCATFCNGMFGVGDDTDSMCLLVMWLLCTQGAGLPGVVWVFCRHLVIVYRAEI